MTKAILAAVATLALIGGAVALVTLRPHPAPTGAAANPTLTTTQVRKVDLSDTRMVAGTLGFGSAQPVKGTGAGVLTKLPAVGTKTARGKALFRVNDQPVVVLYGDTPLFRPIDKPGLTGGDVLELRHNLTALGYHSTAAHDGNVSDASLLAALKRWQKDLDLPGPGVLQPGQAVVLAAPGRVSAVTAQLGDPADGPVLSVSSTTKVVSVPMSPTDASALHTGLAATITLPDGKSVPGKITAIGQVVSSDDDQPKMTVFVTPSKAVTGFDTAPVQVRFTTITRKGVLAVPVGALVALREGGYAMQRPDGSLVAAGTGLFASGMVEVSGPDITEGMTVVTTP
ncbi:HlyD family secretion protein [Actinoplanes sp. TBRC 11911]|uniref:HlyD family efflux transporter periplasmic adaptor subunit n=1 Tax=Actinoplanes sp. TBRC 11911 TaxID=2729386 RepID=UPI00145FAB69|nr:HlyD family efflux transporter periplasmic adaptor subunit [Actinoplanes sp. TBRC 11911]NMO54279.1 HlyD family secretion protein [Actinoplanes sp. TBRC 11911]